jgi:hypothetical protein
MTPDLQREKLRAVEARAAADEVFRQALESDPAAVLAAEGVDLEGLAGSALSDAQLEGVAGGNFVAGGPTDILTPIVLAIVRRKLFGKRR